MTKSVTVLGLEGETLRGVRLDAVKETFTRGPVRAWPLVAPAEEEAAAEGDSLAEAPLLDPAAEKAAATEEIAEADKPLARAFREAAAAFGTREVVLSLPLSHFIVKTLRVPLEARDELASAAQLELDALSPFPDEALAAGVEVVAETDTELIALAAALPEAAAEEVSAARAAAKIDVVRTDATALGWLRGLWPQICAKEGAHRRLVLLDLDGGWDLLVLDDGAPVFIRGLGALADAAALGREILLSLLGLDAARATVDDVVVCARTAPDAAVLARLADFGPARVVLVEDDFAGVEGTARRVVEGAALDVTPATWVEARVEHRFHRRLVAVLAAAGGLWLALMAALFGVDVTYDLMRDHQRSLQREKAHKAAFDDVSAMTNRVALIERYADHSHGALEVLKTVSDSLPPSPSEMAFRAFQYRRGESVKVNGSATEREDVRQFTENLTAAAYEDEDGDPVNVFAKVQSSGGETQTKKGVRFAIECLFTVDEDAAAASGGKGR